MVKRAIAIAAGAIAGIALWYLIVWARDAMEPDPIMSFGDCARSGFDCVGYETAPKEIIPLEARTTPVAPADPCKAWLADGTGASTALLSQCLHTARNGIAREQLEQARWARRTGAAG